MEFIKQYIKIINFSLMGLAFAFASFYLLSNAYHYLEIRKDFYTDFDSQPIVLDINKKIDNVRKNISSFNQNTYNGKMSVNQMIKIKSNLNLCIDSFSNEAITNLSGKKVITIVDVYNLREKYEDEILGDCIVNNLFWTTNATLDNYNSNYLIDNQELIKLYVDSLRNETSYLKKDLLNNSSYFYSTSIASASVKNNTKDGFYDVMSSYNKAASFVEFISNWYKNEVEGNYD